MRIGLLIYGDISTLSGGYLYNRKLVAYLRNQGDHVEIISLPTRGFWRHLNDNFNKDLFKQIVDAQLDILIEDAMVHPSVFLLNKRLVRAINIPIVTLVHLLSSFEQNSWYSAWLYRAIERRYLKSVTGMIVNSHTTLTQLHTLMPSGLPRSCLAVPAGDNFPDVIVDIDRIKHRVLTPGALKILWVGNVIRRKGLHILIKALCQLPEEFQVTIAGRLGMEPAYVKQMQQLIQKADLQDRVIFMGPVEGRALAELYQDHHLMVLPSSYESYGIVYVEAQQFGLPVIGTTAGAAQEIIYPGENGYLIDPNDAKALAKLLTELQQDRMLLLQLSRKALASYHRYPCWAESCAIIREYLSSAIADQ